MPEVRVVNSPWWSISLIPGGVFLVEHNLRAISSIHHVLKGVEDFALKKGVEYSYKTPMHLHCRMMPHMPHEAPNPPH